MPSIDPPIDATFEGDRARYLRQYARVNRADVSQTARDHRRAKHA